MIAVVVSREDTASVNIGRALKEQGSWEQDGKAMRCGDLLLHDVEDMHLEHDNVDQELPCPEEHLDAVVFASRHRSRSRQKTLSVHPIGNYRGADYGGRGQTLVPAAPGLMCSALQGLYDNAASLDYDICYEVTHHGPFLATPTFSSRRGAPSRNGGTWPLARLSPMHCWTSTTAMQQRRSDWAAGTMPRASPTWRSTTMSPLVT